MNFKFFFLVSILLFTQISFASFPVSNDSTGISKIDCDIVILKTGEEISANVFEITPTMIKYKTCNQDSGPLRSVLKEDIFMIKYRDGSKEVIKLEDAGIKNERTSISNYKRYARLSTMFSFLGIVFLLFVSILIGLLFFIPAWIYWGEAKRAQD